jgi:diguanylate cyclase (GGDEF)-like protein
MLADRYDLLVDSVNEAVLVHQDGLLVSANPAAGALFGVESSADLLGRELAFFVPELDHSAFGLLDTPLLDDPDPGLGDRFGGGSASRRRARVLGGDLEERIADVTVLATDHEGSPAVLVVAQDVTESERAEEDRIFRSTHDTLTGLPNRELFQDRMSQAVIRARRTGKRVAVLFVDIDRFRVVNEGAAPAIGDQLLVLVSERLTEGFRITDTIARLTGASFAVICEGGAEISDLDLLGSRALRAFDNTFVVDDEVFHLSASVGVAEALGPEANPTDLVREAEAAMHRAKSRGGGHYEIYDEAVGQQVRARLAVERSLRFALDRDELRVHYQPIISAGSGQVLGLEALLRWQHPEQGLVAPNQFIPIAEETGMIVPIGAWVLGQACTQAATWAIERPDQIPLHMSVNLSARQVAAPGLVEATRGIVQNCGANLETNQVWLEVTESTLMEDPERTSGVLAELQDMGIRIVIDDFGTGYSSLAYLKAFPVNAVKIDRSFVSGLGANLDDEAIVSAVVRLAHALGLDVVAEGVETELQLSRLVDLECDMLQGFLFSRPMAPEDLTDVLPRHYTIPSLT